MKAEEIKKRWQEYTEELYKKDLNDPDNHDGVVTYLQLSDVLSGFRKDRGTRDQIANMHWIIKKARVPEKHLLLLH